MSVHIGIDELADAAAGALDDDRTGEIDSHVHSCPDCAQAWSFLADVSYRLAAEPMPSMPPAVAGRLHDLVQAESRRRAADTGSADSGLAKRRSSPRATEWTAYPRRHTLGAFGRDLPTGSSRSRTLRSVLVAGAAAGVVACAGYVLGAAAGLNEPLATAPAEISSAQLGVEAHALRQSTDVDPHRFSKAWRCARQVTSGRITGLTSAFVDGQPALLVYTTTDHGGVVTVVTGCASSQPTAGPSTTVPR